MAGIYIHIPFCKQKCTYCDFHFSTTYEAYRSLMIASIVDELKKRASYLEGKNIETIYFGGGTPSLLTKDELLFILNTIKALFVIEEDVELTLEANPDDIQESSLKEWKELGFNRLSIGLQSFKASDLKWMNRAHTSEEALNCVQLAQKEGFRNISIDLIYGLPNLTIKEWKETIQTVIDLNITHVSAYCLTVEAKTALHTMVKKKEIVPSDEDQQSEQFITLIETLKKAGIEQYEISNFSKKGFHSKHNSNYWKGKYYLGVGPSAHSFNGVSRSWNIANNQSYMRFLKLNEEWFETEILTLDNQFNELLLTGLRTIYGVSIERLSEIQSFTKDFSLQLQNFKSENWIMEEEGMLKLTEEGKLRADYIASSLFV